MKDEINNQGAVLADADSMGRPNPLLSTERRLYDDFLKSLLRFGNSPKGLEIWQDVKSGISFLIHWRSESRFLISWYEVRPSTFPNP